MSGGSNLSLWEVLRRCETFSPIGFPLLAFCEFVTWIVEGMTPGRGSDVCWGLTSLKCNTESVKGFTSLMPCGVVRGNQYKCAGWRHNKNAHQMHIKYGWLCTTGGGCVSVCHRTEYTQVYSNLTWKVRLCQECAWWQLPAAISRLFISLPQAWEKVKGLGNK